MGESFLKDALQYIVGNAQPRWFIDKNNNEWCNERLFQVMPKEDEPDENRGRIEMDAAAKTTLAPVTSVKTALCITRGRDGDLLLAEMLPQVPGQVDMEGGEAPEPAIANIKR